MKLLEREAPLEALAQARRHASEGRGRIALVSGEAGIGKSALVAGFSAPLHATSVAFGRCDSLFTPRVLGPAYDIAARRGGALLERLETQASRASIFSAFIESLRQGPAGSIVVFEDMHWADEATLDLVKFLGRRIGDVPALLVLTYRDDEVDARHPLRAVLGELPREHCIRIPLAPLTAPAVAHLAGDGADAAALHAATGGNPFYVTEVVAGGGGVPASVRDAVLARAARLTPAARAAADLVSTEPAGMEAWLARACGAVEAALAECEARGMLVAHDGVLRFRHEIARKAVYESLAGVRAAALHGSVLAALRGRGIAVELPARATHHAQAAHDVAAVLEYAPAAARRAASLGAHRQAADHHAAALRFADALPDRERAEMLDAYGTQCHLTLRYDEARDARREAAATWKRLGEAALEAQSRARLAHVLIVSGRNPEAEGEMRAALELVAGLPPASATLAVLTMHAYLRMLERDVRIAIDEGGKALALARRIGDVDSEIMLLNTIGAAMLVDDDAAGIEVLERSRALAQERGRDHQVANAFGNLGSACGEVHRFAEARGYLEGGIAYARARDLDSHLHYQGSWLALTQLYLGCWSDCADTARPVLASASAIARIMALLAMGRLRARRGDPGAWQALDEALHLADSSRTLQRLAPVHAARAEAAWLEGEDGAAAREATACWNLALEKRHAWFVGELAYWRWKGGQLSAAPAIAARPFALQIEGRWREAAAEWRARACPYEEARALAEGDVQARLEAVRIFTELGARPAAERARQSLRASGVRRIPRGPRASTKAHPAGLTAREMQIVALLREGLTNAEIAARLHISPKTVDHHVSAVLAKLGVESRREAAKAAPCPK
jgi:DNA-binding CsgD family transcriptional regulator